MADGMGKLFIWIFFIQLDICHMSAIILIYNLQNWLFSYFVFWEILLSSE